MEYLKIRFLLQLALLAFCVSCSSSKQIKGESPFIRISSLSVMADALAAEFDIHNINDVVMHIDAIDIKIVGEDIQLVHYATDIKLAVDPNTTEEVSLQGSPNSKAAQLLQDLESGRISSLPFSLEGRVHTLDDGYLPFKNEGHLYPVPGRPGQFRSASSRISDDR